MKKLLFVMGSVLAVTALRGANLLPIRTFLRNPAYSAVQLSPDGRYLSFASYVGDKDGRTKCYVTELATGKISKFDLPSTDLATGPVVVTSFTWVNDHRILLSVYSDFVGPGALAVNIDGTHLEPLSGFYKPSYSAMIYASEVLHVFGGNSDSVLMLQRPTGEFKNPTVLKINTVTGSMGMVASSNEGVTNWVADRAGTVRVGIKWNGSNSGVIYRENDEATWHTLHGFDVHGRGGFPVAFDYDGHTAYIIAVTEFGTWGIYNYDLAAQKIGPLVFANKTYDVINPNDIAARGGLIFSKKKQKLIGLRYLEEAERTVWFDEEMTELQAALDHSIPGVTNTMIGWSNDENKIMVKSWSDRQPGIYYLFDRGTQQLLKICDSAAWVTPGLMAETEAVEFKARDGLLIHGFLTYPPNAGKKGLPLVVMPHGGPWVRDSKSFDGLVQFLANRGYVVLRPNYRGSTGYGDAFSQAGHRQIGKAIQNDITDGVQWAVQAGIADPKRLAILGASYGGYSVQWALTNTPELYRCGVSIAGVSDWLSIIKERDQSEESRDVYRYWKEQIGDPETDEGVLREISPINHVDRIKVPIFVVHGKDDRVVPVSQSVRLVAELKRRGLPYEEMFKANEGHTLFGYKNRIDLFTQIETFLAKNMQ